jgi:RNase P/RNase MRP subunit p29
MEEEIPREEAMVLRSQSGTGSATNSEVEVSSREDEPELFTVQGTLLLGRPRRRAGNSEVMVGFDNLIRRIPG